MNKSQNLDDNLWKVAAGLYGIGDVLTTAIGIRDRDITENNPYMRWVIDNYGPAGMVVWKSTVLAGFYGLYHIMPDDIDIGIPAGLSLVGTGVTISNLMVISKSKTSE